ncbi:MAG: ABC-2 transporter permease [Clostridia bacterium]|nr:ABC-2 transporter permease [Clostridia bacterium]
MKHFNKYMLYRLKSSAIRTLILTLIASVFVFVLCIETISVLRYENGRYYQNSATDSAGVVMLALSVLLPILETYSLKDGKTLDVVFSLPIKRRSIAAAHYLSGIIQLIFISLAAFLTANFTTLIAGRNGYFATVHMIPMFFVTLLFSLCIYSFVIFIFGKANTLGDGIVFVAGFYGAVCFILEKASSLFETRIFISYFSRNILHTDDIVESFSLIVVMLAEILEFFDGKVDAYIFNDYYKSTTTLEFFNNSELLTTLIIWLVIGILCTVGYIFTVSRYRAEKAGDISDSVFGYRFIIPAFGFSLMVGSIDNSALTNILILMAMLIGYIIYRRSFKIKLEDLFTIAAALVFQFL